MAAAPKIVIVGASLAGLRTAEAVVAALPDADVTIVGAETQPPYNRPPLSKDILKALIAGRDAVGCLETVTLRTRLSDGPVTWRLGQAVVRVEMERRTVHLADGARLPYDWLIAATGLRPRRLSVAGAEDRRHVLRTFDDAIALGMALAGRRRLVVVGGGFIGMELAATAVAAGCTVTVVEPMAQPMAAALGSEVGAAMAALHRHNGVDLRLGRKVVAVAGRAMELDDGTAVEGDVLVEAVGSLPNVEWLIDCGLDLDDGILCDDRMIAVGSDRILGVGDVARFPNPLFGPDCRRVEHWCVPGQTARRAAEVMAALEDGRTPTPRFAPMPSFWSDQHGIRLQSFGAPALADAISVVEGDLDAVEVHPCIVRYHRTGTLVGVLGIGAPPQAMAAHRRDLERSLAGPLPA